MIVTCIAVISIYCRIAVIYHKSYFKESKVTRCLISISNANYVTPTTRYFTVDIVICLARGLLIFLCLLIEINHRKTTEQAPAQLAKKYISLHAIARVYFTFIIISETIGKTVRHIPRSATAKHVISNVGGVRFGECT
jgi:hypothetical protein